MTSPVARKLKQTRTASGKTRKGTAAAARATTPTLIINNDENEGHMFVNMGNGKMTSLSTYLKGTKKGGRRTRHLRKHTRKH